MVSSSTQLQPAPLGAQAKTALTSTDDSSAREAAMLLHQFNALALGEGSLNAGANTLTAMVLAIANLAPPGSCITDGEGVRVSVGMNLLVHGGLSCALIEEYVLSLMTKLQGNVYGHIRQRHARKRDGEVRVSEGDMCPNKGDKDPTPTVLDRLEKNSFFSDASCEAEWRSLLRPPLDQEIGEITEAPVFFAGIGSAQGLDTAIGFANKGRLLVHTGLTRKADAAMLESVIREVVTGCPKRKLLATHIKGELIATDPLGILDGLLADGKDRGWLGRMLWLVDRADGPKFNLHDVASTEPKLRRVVDSFSLAIEGVTATRLNIHKTTPMEVKLPMDGEQTRWCTFLLGLEPRFPGIAGTLRPLWASLVFGLGKIAASAPADQRIRFSAKSVEALARVLALRMVHHREVVLEAGRHKLLENLAASFRIKLMDGPHSVRDFQRRSNRIDAPTCLEVLERLADSGSVVRRGSLWQLANHVPSKALTVDV